MKKELFKKPAEMADTWHLSQDGKRAAWCKRLNTKQIEGAVTVWQMSVPFFLFFWNSWNSVSFLTPYQEQSSNVEFSVPRKSENKIGPGKTPGFCISILVRHVCIAIGKEQTS